MKQSASAKNPAFRLSDLSFPPPFEEQAKYVALADKFLGSNRDGQPMIVEQGDQGCREASLESQGSKQQAKKQFAA
jgi:hypothetical protein